MSAPISVVLVDDDAMVRTALSMILGAAPEITVVGQAEDGRQALSVIAEHSPDVVLMDIRMPRLDGLAATDALVRSGSPSKVVVLTTFDADDDVMRALQHGADGFLLKDTPPDRIVEAVRLVAAGQSILSPSVTAGVLASVRDARRAGDDSARQAARDRLAALTDRELEVAQAVGAGMSNAEISRELYLSVATVKAHLGRILDKLGADNRVQVAITVHDAELDPRP
ncbi:MULTISPECIES: response regulator [Janibacter]|uniref:response regulator n=1 Tax=Janibacter TaxID=53457 RepID=UPI0021A3CF60|nr:response regulator transcription factor [Janibacter hoylei]MCT1617720.1 response regulator transcription factor [Janibacter hoylei]MCT2292389.1 response regulator transcription factor [Janibacter hoylei]